MALRRIDKKKAVAARTVRPRAVAIAARQAYLARTQRNVPDDSVADPPESGGITRKSVCSDVSADVVGWKAEEGRKGKAG
jgi:hypothetical protein